MRITRTHLLALATSTIGTAVMSGCTDPADEYIVIHLASEGILFSQAVRVGDCNWVRHGALLFAQPYPDEDYILGAIPNPDDRKTVEEYLKDKTR